MMRVVPPEASAERRLLTRLDELRPGGEPVLLLCPSWSREWMVEASALCGVARRRGWLRDGDVVAFSASAVPPFGVVRSLGSWAAAVEPFAHSLEVTAADTVWVTGPVWDGLFGFVGWQGLQVGARVVLRWEDPSEATVVYSSAVGVGTVLGLVREGVCGRVHTVVVLGEACSAEMRGVAQGLGVRLLEVYAALPLGVVGWAEAGGALVPFPGVAWSERDGRVWVDSPYVARCALEPTRPSGWLVDTWERHTVGDSVVFGGSGVSEGLVFRLAAGVGACGVGVTVRDLEELVRGVVGSGDVVVVCRCVGGAGLVGSGDSRLGVPPGQVGEVPGGVVAVDVRGGDVVALPGTGDVVHAATVGVTAEVVGAVTCDSPHDAPGVARGASDAARRGTGTGAAPGGTSGVTTAGGVPGAGARDTGTGVARGRLGDASRKTPTDDTTQAASGRVQNPTPTGRRPRMLNTGGRASEVTPGDTVHSPGESLTAQAGTASTRPVVAAAAVPDGDTERPQVPAAPACCDVADSATVGVTLSVWVEGVADEDELWGRLVAEVPGAVRGVVVQGVALPRLAGGLVDRDAVTRVMEAGMDRTPKRSRT